LQRQAAKAKERTGAFFLKLLAGLAAVKPSVILATKPFAILTTLFSAVIGFRTFKVDFYYYLRFHLPT
tara:strand:- start:227 stop:430 length:204 start_codon:yes stop_codon:yes gene_type:complete